MYQHPVKCPDGTYDKYGGIEEKKRWVKVVEKLNERIRYQRKIWKRAAVHDESL